MARRKPETFDDLLRTVPLTYSAIAERARVSRRTLFGAREGRMPRRDTLVKLAGALGVTVDRLVAAIESTPAKP